MKKRLFCGLLVFVLLCVLCVPTAFAGNEVMEGQEQPAPAALSEAVPAEAVDTDGENTDPVPSEGAVAPEPALPKEETPAAEEVSDAEQEPLEEVQETGEAVAESAIAADIAERQALEQMITDDVLSMTDTDGYVPGEVLVVFKEKAEPKKAAAILDTIGKGVEEVIVADAARRGVPAVQKGAMPGKSVVTEENMGDDVFVLQTREDLSVAGTVELLNELEEVDIAQPNFMYEEAATTISDPNRGSQLEGIDAYKAWDYSRADGSLTGRAPVIVAVIDSGIDGTHPDLKNQIYRPYDVHTDKTGITNIQDYRGHGTAVAGIIAAEINGVGAAGVSYNAKIMPISVWNPDRNTYTTQYMITAYDYAVNNGARVINISLGGPRPTLNSWDTLLNNCIDNAAAQNIVTVCAAGNDNSSAYYLPSDVESAISVIWLNKLLDIDIKHADSNYGPQKDISAPGTNLPTTANGGGYANVSGTSAAAPVVSGVVALILAANPSLTVDQVKDILYTTATDLGTPGRDDTFGHGKVNAYRAVLKSQNPQGAVTMTERLFAMANGSISGSDTPNIQYHAGLLTNGSHTARSLSYHFAFVYLLNNNPGLTDRQFVVKLYQGLLGREPSQSEIDYRMARLNAGMSRQSVFFGITDLAEYYYICVWARVDRGTGSSSESRDQSYEITSFVNRMYTEVLSRKGSPAELNDVTYRLRSGQMSGRDVAYSFFWSAEYLAKNTSDEVFVMELYCALLGRVPELDGYLAWLHSLYGGSSRLAVFDGIASSAEFAAVCRQCGIRVT
ncbi:MAG TPA: hypothetical protein DEB31_07505 [Clostridiales bacterium]|nr:hypothetical protein [Clostridiales bacterium]